MSTPFKKFMFALGLFGLVSTGVRAATITIEDADFSQTDLNSSSTPGISFDSTRGNYTNGYAVGWTVTGSGGVFAPIVSGPAYSGSNPLPSTQVGWSNGGSLSQTLSANLAAGTVYTFSADVISRPDAMTPSGWTIELLAGNNVIITLTGSPGIAANTWVDFSGSFTATAASSLLGDKLSIAASSPGPQLDFTNVSLTTSAVPELSTWAMMLLGLAGLGFAANRRANKSAASIA